MTSSDITRLAIFAVIALAGLAIRRARKGSDRNDAQGTFGSTIGRQLAARRAMLARAGVLPMPRIAPAAATSEFSRRPTGRVVRFGGDVVPKSSSTEVRMNPISFAIFVIFLLAAGGSLAARQSPVVAIVLALIGLLIAVSLKMARQWEKAVVLRAGRLQGIKGPGLFFIIPVLDNITAWIDQRIRTSEFSAEQALTKDTVPVNVDAIVFWMVHDAERAALEIADYNSAVQRVAQTSLREMIGSSLLSDLLSERKEADVTLKTVIGAKTAEWGVTVSSVEIRDVAIPDNLQDAMSRQAQAEREKQARVTLGSAEEEVAQKFVNAAKLYAQNPEALQLRAMNIIYETTKERGATILMPSSMVDAMNPGIALGLMGRVALQQPNPAPTAPAANPPGA